MLPTPEKRLPELPLESLSPNLFGALALLLEARQYALELSADPWDWAVEIRCLRAAGASHSLLRWLVCRGYAEHALERAPDRLQRRSFRRTSGLMFTEASCFVLTAAGSDLSRLGANRGGGPLGNGCPNGGPLAELPEGGRPLPQWHGELRELRIQGILVKQFRQPAPNQEAILAAFEEEGWPSRIDDPLSPNWERDPKHQLHITIQNLNRHQKHRLLRFTGDGNGRGVRWQFHAPPARGATAGLR
jgi:hypothetical protein